MSSLGYMVTWLDVALENIFYIINILFTSNSFTKQRVKCLFQIKSYSIGNNQPI